MTCPVPQLVHCSCKKSHCVQATCSCLKLKLKCTPACGCLDCENTDNDDIADIAPTEAEREGDSDMSDSESENDD